jgi:hypothetical protein
LFFKTTSQGIGVGGFNLARGDSYRVNSIQSSIALLLLASSGANLQRERRVRKLYSGAVHQLSEVSLFWILYFVQNV